MNEGVWEEATECGICSGGEFVPVVAICGKRFVRCRQCDTVRLFDRVKSSRLDLIYSDYYDHSDPTAAELEIQLQNPTFAFRQRRLEKFIPPADRSILETGCGDGNFLAYLRRCGWKPCGMEFNEESAQLARRRHHLEVTVGNLSEAPCGNGKYPALAAYHVVEHVYRPVEWLRNIRATLCAGGILHLQTPNFANWTRTLSRSHWASYVFPQHVYLFDPQTLARLLEQEGFTPLNITTWDPWHGPGSVSRSIYAVARYGLRGKSSWSDQFEHSHGELTRASIAKGGRTKRTFIRALLRSGLEATSYAWSSFESSLGHGGVVDILAKVAT